MVNIIVLLNVLNINFILNKVVMGGCVFVNVLDGILIVKFINVKFEYCNVSRIGCVFVVGEFFLLY